MSWLVSMRIDSSWAWSSRWASSMTRTGVRPRSACSTASASTAGGAGGGGGGGGRGVVGERGVRGGGEDLVVDAADPGRRVGQVDDRVSRGVKGVQGGAD